MSKPVSRVRWAAVGAAVAVVVGAGGLHLARATTPAGASAFVPITPCRLFDTRPAPNTVGVRATPLGADETHTFTVRGANGNCTIPVEATAVTINLTAVGGATANTFLTAWPTGEVRPTASVLNVKAGDTVATPNLATVRLSAGGQFDLFNKAGLVNVIGDITGYFTDHAHDDRYYTKAQTDVLVAGVGGGNVGHVVSTLDNVGNSGLGSEVAIGVDGNPIIAYYAADSSDLKVVHCTSPACTTADAPRTLDSVGGVGLEPSMTIGADGNPIIAYRDGDASDLKVVHCTNPACTATDPPRVVDSTGLVGAGASITIGADGLAIISYLDVSARSLKVVHCADTACTTSDPPRILGPASGAGGGSITTSITIGADGNPFIAYTASADPDLNVVHCTTPTCASSDPARTVDATGAVGFFPAVAIGVDGLPIIAYRDSSNNDLKMVHCTNVECTTNGSIRVLDGEVEFNVFTSITIGSDGMAIISYYDSVAGDLNVVRCSHVTCTTNDPPHAVETVGDVGSDTSITIGVDGLPVISYLDRTNSQFKLVHCANTSCLPFHRPR